MAPFGLPALSVFLYAIVIAAVLIYVPYGVVAYARFQVGFDMGSPRASFDKLPDYGKRAVWAHQNSFEAFMIFAAAAMMAYVTNTTSSTALWAAIVYTPARLLYSLFYMLNIPLGRSLMYGVGSLCVLVLFATSLSAVS